jgi:hypothetical protein
MSGFSLSGGKNHYQRKFHEEWQTFRNSFLLLVSCREGKHYLDFLLAFLPFHFSNFQVIIQIPLS